MVKASIEVVKNVDGRVESGTVIVQGRKLRFNNVWDDDGLLRMIQFDGREVPTAAELYWFMNEKFIERIRLIDLIDEITLIDTIDRINTIGVIESIASMPNITILGSEGAAFEQTAPVAGGYFSPTGVEPPFVGWVDVDDAFDGLLATYAYISVAPLSYSTFLILTFAATICDKVRIYAYSPNSQVVDIDVYQGSAWIDVYEGSFINNAWLEKSFSQGLTSKVRVRFKNNMGFIFGPVTYWLNEVEMWRSPADSTLLVSAINLDIRDLTSASDSVEVKQATAANLNANVFTKHDNKTYKTAVFDAAASGNLVAAVAAKVIKLHALTIQAQGTVVVNLNNGSGGSSLMEWSFQAREGAVVPMANAPAYWAITGVNTILYVTLSAAVTVTITAIYSDDDSS